jgi:hypothetical protein
LEDSKRKETEPKLSLITADLDVQELLGESCRFSVGGAALLLNDLKFNQYPVASTSCITLPSSSF